MSEKAIAYELHPMRGHSRGEWYAAQEDIVNSEAEAEYWALFSVTHRGNKHCVGEFATKLDALAALKLANKELKEQEAGDPEVTKFRY